MWKEIVQHVCLFIGLLFFLLSLYRPSLLLVIASFGFSLIALSLYRQKHPRVDRNFKKN